jgi:DNA-directed RNA polymerase specialized sigma24 family protein
LCNYGKTPGGKGRTKAKIFVKNGEKAKQNQRPHPDGGISFYEEERVRMEKEAVMDAHLNRFRRGEISRRKLEGLIFLHIRNHPWIYSEIGDRDEAMDFLSWFYPRIKHAVDRYVNQGYSFDSYVKKLIRYSAKEFRRCGREKRHTEACYWNCAAASDVEQERGIADPEKECLRGEDEKLDSGLSNQAQALPLRIDGKQILMLLLKNYHAVSDSFINRAAKRLEMSAAQVHALVEQMKILREKQDKQLWRLRESIHSQYYRLMNYEYRKNMIGPNGRHYELFQDRVRRHRLRLQKMRERYQGMRRNASNKEIALVMNIPKGTVDSAFDRLRRRVDHCLGMPKLAGTPAERQALTADVSM